MSENTRYVVKGNGTAIHIAHEQRKEDGTVWLLATRCDGWGACAGRRIRYVEADAATCKSCLRFAGEGSA